MNLVKRWGVMTLVALLVLGTMSAALAAEEASAESKTAGVPLDPGSYAFAPDWAKDLVTFVFYWGFDEGEMPACEDVEATPSVGTFFGPLPDADADSMQCVQLDVEKNGHVNHGSMVSSFVHWLKVGNLADLSEESQDMPNGQLVKSFAHDDFGKGFFEMDEPAGSGLESDRELSGNDGPPSWVKAKKADKPAKGRNK